MLGDFYIINNKNDVLFSTKEDIIGSKYFGSNRNEIFTALEEQKEYLANFATSEKFHFSIINLILKKRLFSQLQTIKWKLSFFIFLSLLIIALISAVILNIILKRLKILLNNMLKVQEGNLNVRINVKANDEIGHIGTVFNNMCEKLKNYIEKVYLSEIKQRKAEIKALQAQINPHFIYNTLATLQTKAEIAKNNELSNFINNLGNIFRFSFRNDEKYIRLEHDLEFIISYIDIQNYRFDNKIEMILDIDEKVMDYAIPKLLLQPIVENAIIHGFSHKDSDCILTIRGRILEKEKIILSVEDNGIGMSANKIKEIQKKSLKFDQIKEDNLHLGLVNTNQRMKLIFGKDYGLKITSHKNKGTKVIIILPAKTKKELINSVSSFNS